MTFIDTDEYLVPLQGNSWHAVFDSIEPDVHVLKMRSTRGKPRVDLMEAAPDQSVCENPNHRKERLPIQPCVVPRRNETFLRVYNCDFIKPPRPDRFARAMKQIYRPSFVLSHFVHYSTVTTGIARFFEDVESSNFTRAVQPAEWGDKFLDELNEGILIHTKSVLPHETAARDAACRVDSRNSCQVGIVCPESTPFVDEEHKKNVFTDAKGNFCNCWINPNVEALIPRLEEEMRRVGGQEVVAMA